MDSQIKEEPENISDNEEADQHVNSEPSFMHIQIKEEISDGENEQQATVIISEEVERNLKILRKQQKESNSMVNKTTHSNFHHVDVKNESCEEVEDTNPFGEEVSAAEWNAENLKVEEVSLKPETIKQAPTEESTEEDIKEQITLPEDTASKASEERQKRKRKASDIEEIERHMDEASKCMKNILVEETKDICSQYGDLLAEKLRSLDEETCKTVMKEIEKLLSEGKTSSDSLHRTSPFSINSSTINSVSDSSSVASYFSFYSAQAERFYRTLRQNPAHFYPGHSASHSLTHRTNLSDTLQSETILQTSKEPRESIQP